MRLNPLLSQLRTYPQVALDQKKREVQRAGRALYDLGTGDPLEPTPPWIREAIRGAVPEISQYPTVRGPLALRQAIAGYMTRRFGLSLDPEAEILPTSGSKEAIFHLPLLVIDPRAEDRLVIVPDPGYPVYARGALFAGGEPCYDRLSDDFVQRPWELPTDVLRRARMMFINTPHNPSGAVTPREALARTWEVCRDHDILLVNDECYADVYADSPPPSLLEVGTKGALVVHSLSKRSGMTGYRSGFVAGDAEAVRAFAELRVNLGVAPQDIVNEGATVAWADDHHAAERRALLAEKKRVFTALFDELGLTLVASQASLYLWFKPPPGLDDEQYALKLLDVGIVVSPGRYFGVTDAGNGYVRAAMVPPLTQCREAAALWREVHRTL